MPRLWSRCAGRKGEPAGGADDWISARIKLSEINEGFANMKSGKVLRSVIMFDA